jgi:hypothetical protein
VDLWTLTQGCNLVWNFNLTGGGRKSDRNRQAETRSGSVSGASRVHCRETRHLPLFCWFLSLVKDWAMIRGPLAAELIRIKNPA